MGLTLNYKLRLPGELSPAAVLGVLRQLHHHAAGLGFPRLSPVFHVARGQDVFVDPALAAPLENLFRHMTAHTSQLCDEDGEPFTEWSDTATADAMGFAVDPGDGSECATFGFVAPTRPATIDRAGGPCPPSDWFWDAFCKTQYASNNGDAHFVRCHTSLVALLDAAVKLGIRVEVVDEGEYWETRSTEHLLAVLLRNNVIMARMAAALRDKLASPDDLQAPIFEHPDFEAMTKLDVNHPDEGPP